MPSYQDLTNNGLQLVRANSDTGVRYGFTDQQGVKNLLPAGTLNDSHFQSIGINPSQIPTVDVNQWYQGTSGGAGGGVRDINSLNNFFTQQISDIKANKNAQALVDQSRANLAASGQSLTYQGDPNKLGTGIPNGNQPVSTQTTGITLANGQQPGGLKIPKGQEGFVFDPTTGKQVSPAEKALNDLKVSGKPAPPDSASAIPLVNAAIDSVTPANPKAKTTPNVDNFFQSSANVQTATQNLMDFLMPQNVKDNLVTEMTKITDEKNILAQDKLQLMNLKNVMAGTTDDLRTEITKANGFATESQIQALAVARNKTLLKQATFLQDIITSLQDTIANDTSLLNFEKDMAHNQFTQRMQIMQFVQQNQQNIQNGARQSIETLIKTPGGLIAYANNPAEAAKAEAIMGWSPGTIANIAAQPNYDQLTKQVELAKAKVELANAPLESSLKKAQIANIYDEMDKRKIEMAKILNDLQGGGKEGKKTVIGVDSNGRQVLTTQQEAKKMGLSNIIEAPSSDVSKTMSARQWLALVEGQENATNPENMGIVQIIDKLDKKNALGALASRWNEFLVGQFGSGTGDSEKDALFETLRTKIGLSQTLLMNLHVGSRGGAYMLEHFEDLANAKKLNANTLKAGVKAEINYAKDRAMQPSNSQTSSQTSNEDNGYGGYLDWFHQTYKKSQ